MSSTERVEWVEIIEPKTKEHMYANLTTGECVWDPPPGVQVKKTDDNQWWELYDQNTARFYYYNASSQKTVWHRPQNCDIIPLAKLQTLKQNTEVQDEEDNKINIKKETVATQTNTKGLVRAPVREAVSNNSNRSVRSITISTQTSPASSPRERRKHHHHHHHHHHHLKRGSSPSSSPSVGPPGNKKQDDNAVNGENRLHSRGGGQQLGSWQQSQSQQTFSGGNVGTKGSSRSSDSSTISQSRSSLEGPGHVLFRRHDSCCSNESGGSANSQRHDVARGRGPDQNGAVVPGYEHRSHHPPEFGISGRQRSLDIDQHPGVHGSSNQMMWRQNSVDSPIGVSRSSSMRMGLGPGRMPEVISDSTPRMQRRIQDTSPGAQDNLGYQDYGTTLDPLSTPVSNRRNWARSSSRSTDSSMSSPQSPLGMPNVQVARDNDGAVLTFGDSGRGGNLNNRQASEDSSPLSLDSSHQNMDSGLESRMSSMESQQRSGVSSGNRNATSPANRIARSSSKSFDRDSQMNVSGGKQPAHSREGSEVSIGSYFHNTIFGDSQKPNRTSNGDSPRLNEQPTPLYSNLDYPYLFDRKSDNQSYLLPLQHYLLEQAKLSGCRFGDFIGDDRDSLSQSDDDSDGRRDEEDDFADDEGMSHQDSSSQEYLDDSRFLDDEDEEEEEQTYCEPMSPPPQHRGKASHKIGLDPRLDHLDYAESDNSSLFSNSPVLPPRNPVSQTGGNISTQHASLRRKRIESQSGPSPALEKSQSFQPDMGQGGGHRPLSLMATSTTESNVSTNPVTGSLQRQPGAPVGNAMFKDKKPPSESDIEKYAQDNLNRHKKGIFRKKFTIQELLSWSKDPIRKPMIMTADKTLKREACEIFKLILTYMGDRKSKGNQTGDSVALDLATRGWSKAAVRDELFIQICRQTTDNPRKESLLLGWELLAICLTFFPPSVKFQPYLESYIGRHKDTTFDTAELKISHYAAICSKRLERIGQSGAKKGLRKPTIEEIDQSRIQIFRPSMFGNTLEEVMAIQKNRYPHYKLPWIQTTLSEAVLKLNGAQTEGIFRVPGDIDEVNAMKLRMDQWEEVEANDPHVPASLLKLWYRELYEPLIPSVFYQECVDQCNEPEVAVQIVQKLPEINRMVLSYLVRFLQVFAAEANSSVTKMDASNLAMVMAPNCLRCMSDDPRIIFENTRKEMAFMRILIQHLDTSYMEGIM